MKSCSKDDGLGEAMKCPRQMGSAAGRKKHRNIKYKYASGREGDSLHIGFSPRKTNISVYMLGGLSLAEAVLKKLGKFKTGGGCMYMKRFSDVDETQLVKMLETAFHSKGPAR